MSADEVSTGDVQVGDIDGDGHPDVFAANGGEVIRPHPKFRVIATGNSAGAGDTSGLYQGVLRHNLAFLDRFRVVQVSYPDAATEQGLIKTLVPSLPEAIGEKMVQVAGEVRRLFLGQADTGQELTVTLSTRALVRWARLALTFKGAPQPLAYTLDQALTARAEPEQREAIHHYLAVVRLRPDHANAHNNLAGALLKVNSGSLLATYMNTHTRRWCTGYRIL